MGVFTDILKEGSDEPGISIDQLGAAIAYWSWMQDGNDAQTVATAALMFNTTPDIVRRALEVYPWTLCSGPDDDPTKQIIEHDGE